MNESSSALPSTVVSVDLDDAACYHAIHGLEEPTREQAAAALERWLPRFLDLFSRAGVKATFFVIGRDVRRDMDAGGRGARLLEQALAEGHELANHGFAHAYDLVTWSSERQHDDLAACDAVLRELGADPIGFRAPGYTHDSRLLSQVVELGYTYDSSSLPSPPYFAAKLAVMGLMALRGRSSASQRGRVASFIGDTHPYRRRDVDLWELPMSVSPRLRLPLIGTTLLATPGRVSGSLRRAAAKLDHFHLELHAIDLADASRDAVAPALARIQPELRVPWRVRRERLWELLARRGSGATLRSALPVAAQVSRTR